MRYKITKNGKEINIIEASENFVKSYCKENGFAYEESPLPPQPEPEPAPKTPTPTAEELAAENDHLKAQVEALSEQQTFLEDCLTEMAGVIYA